MDELNIIEHTAEKTDENEEYIKNDEYVESSNIDDFRIIKGAEPSEIHWTARKLIEKYVDKEINTDIEIQRGYVWKDNDRKSALICSMICSKSIPPLYMNKIDEIYEVEDGVQRILTVFKFINNEFELSGLDPIPVRYRNGEEDEIDINGFKFNELKEVFKDAIKDYNFTIIFTDNASEEEVADTFYNLNNGQAMSSSTACRAKAKSMKQIARLGKHRLFKEALTNKAWQSRTQDNLAIRSHAILNDDSISLNESWMRAYMKNADITEEDENLLNKIFDRIVNVHSLIDDNKVAKKMYVKTHLISIIPIIAQSFQDNLTDEDVMKWFVSFFVCSGHSTTTSTEYNRAAGRDGTSKNSAVKKRLNEIKKSYDNYFSATESLAS